MHYKNFTDCHHTAVITTITVSTFNNNNRISILKCAYYEYEKMYCIPRLVFKNFFMYYSRFQITLHCNISNFVAKFKSSFQNSQAGLYTKHLIGFDEFRDQSQPLFTNRLANSKMNF